MKTKKFKISIVAIFTVIMVMLGVAWTSKKMGYSENDAWNELLALDSESTMEDLKKKGYVDVSQTMDSQNDVITSFLEDISKKKKSILKIANLSDEKLCAKILVYNSDLDAIVMHTIYPNQQQAESPGKCFSTETFLTNQGDVITVYLKNIPNESIPYFEKQTLLDETLYSYMEKSALK